MADMVRVLFHHDPNKVEAAAIMICDQCAYVPAKRVAYTAARVIPALLAALRAHPDHAGVQEWVCAALGNVCLDDDGNNLVRRFFQLNFISIT